MGFIFASLRKDLSRWWQDKAAMLIWLGIPFMIGGLITSLIDSNDGGKPTGTLLIADLDNGLLSGLVAGAFGQGDLGELIIVETVPVEEGNERIEAGEASGFLIIPDGFTDAFINDTPVTLTLKTNPSQTILPGIIQDVTEVLLDLGFYAQQLLGDQIEQILDSDLEGAPTEVFVADISVQIQNKIDVIAPKVFPPVIDIEIVEPPPEEPRPNYALWFLPGIVLMAILFSANSLAGDYWVERDNGTLRRLVSVPGQLGTFVAGKALAAAAVLGAIATITLIVGFAYHEVAWAKLPSSVAWVTVSGVGLFAWFAALQMLFPNQKAANLVTTILLFPLLMAGGSFFPLAALPDWIASIGRMAPNGFVVDRLTIELTAATAWSIDLNSWLVVLGMTALGLAISTWRLRSGFARR
jgi:ABC-type multidrug transport system permease subunit